MIYLGYTLMAFVGLSLGILGGGGSILALPILVYLFGVEAQNATNYSLFIVGLSSLLGAIPYLQRKEIDFYNTAIFLSGSLLGVFLVKKILLPLIPDLITISSFSFSKNSLILVVFSFIMIAAALSMFKPQKTQQTNQSKKSLAMIILSPIGIGSLTAFVGAGGGFLIVPTLLFFFKLPLRVATGTSLLIIALNSLSGFILSNTSKNIDWTFLLTTCGITITFVFVGAKIAPLFSEKKLKKSFAILILMSASWILFQQIFLK